MKLIDLYNQIQPIIADGRGDMDIVAIVLPRNPYAVTSSYAVDAVGVDTCTIEDEIDGAAAEVPVGDNYFYISVQEI